MIGIEWPSHPPRDSCLSSPHTIGRVFWRSQGAHRRLGRLTQCCGHFMHVRRQQGKSAILGRLTDAMRLPDEILSPQKFSAAQGGSQPLATASSSFKFVKSSV